MIAVLIITSFLLVACQQATEEPTPTREPAIGSEENQIKVLFDPSVDAHVLVSGGEVMAPVLNEAT